MFSDSMGFLAQPIEELGQSIGGWFSDVLGSIDNLRDSVLEWFGDILSNLDGLRYSLSQWFGDIFSSVENLGRNVGEWFGSVLASLENLGRNVGEWFGVLLSYIDPFSDKFFLKLAFVPSESYIEQFIIDVKEVYDEKFSFVGEVGYVLGRLFGALIVESSEPPSFSITLPGGKWGSGTVEIIDFSFIAEYRFFIKNFIRVLLWVPFLLKLYKKLPSIIYL